MNNKKRAVTIGLIASAILGAGYAIQKQHPHWRQCWDIRTLGLMLSLAVWPTLRASLRRLGLCRDHQGTCAHPCSRPIARLSCGHCLSPRTLV